MRKLLKPNLNKIKMIINSLKKNKASREDNLNSELIKLTKPYLVIYKQKLIGSIQINKWIPKDLNTVIVYTVFKKRNITKVEN